MHEVRRRAGARQRRGDLAGDVARLADAADDDAPLAGEDQGNRGEKTLVEARAQARSRWRPSVSWRQSIAQALHFPERIAKPVDPADTTLQPILILLAAAVLAVVAC